MMSDDECYKTALQMIKVTPDNVSKFDSDMILKVYDTIVEAYTKLGTRIPDDYQSVDLS